MTNEESVLSGSMLSALMDLNRGKFLVQAGTLFKRLRESILDTGQKGTLTITLEVSPNTMVMGRAAQMNIKPKCKIVEPLPSQGSSIFFVDADGNLTREDPDQMDMFEDKKENQNRG